MYFINVYPVFVGARDVGTRYQASELLLIYLAWCDDTVEYSRWNSYRCSSVMCVINLTNILPTLIKWYSADGYSSNALLKAKCGEMAKLKNYQYVVFYDVASYHLFYTAF